MYYPQYLNCGQQLKNESKIHAVEIVFLVNTCSKLNHMNNEDIRKELYE